MIVHLFCDSGFLCFVAELSLSSGQAFPLYNGLILSENLCCLNFILANPDFTPSRSKLLSFSRRLDCPLIVQQGLTFDLMSTNLSVCHSRRGKGGRRPASFPSRCCEFALIARNAYIRGAYHQILSMRMYTEMHLKPDSYLVPVAADPDPKAAALLQVRIHLLARTESSSAVFRDVLTKYPSTSVGALQLLVTVIEMVFNDLASCSVL